MRQVEAGKVSAIVVWRLDRLGRTAKGLTALFQELFEQKVNLVSLRDGIDLNTPAGRLMAKMLASVARYETEVRAERVLAGQAKARADGKRGGWHLRSRAEVVADSPGICGSERRFVRASVRISGRNRRIRPENGQMGRAVFSPCDDVDAITGTCSLPRARGEREERPSIRTNASNTLVDCVLDRVSGRSPSSSRCNSDLAFDPVSGMLYASHGPQLYIVDKATAQPTFVGSTTSTLSTPATRWTPCASSSMTSARTDRTHRPRRGRHGTWTIPAWRRDGGGQGRREVSFHAWCPSSSNSGPLHAIADKIEGFTREFHGDATKGTGIDELVEQAKALIHDAASRTPLMGAPAAEQAKLAKALKLKRR